MSGQIHIFYSHALYVTKLLHTYIQMLVVDKKIPSEDQFAKDKDKGSFNIDEFIWPHGLTPPLHHVRKRRFRKRVNRRTIESVEQEVERLLDEDALATEVKYGTSFWVYLH